MLLGTVLRFLVFYIHSSFVFIFIEILTSVPFTFSQHVLRELPSSPVPASCCTALLEAYSKPVTSLA